MLSHKEFIRLTTDVRLRNTFLIELYMNLHDLNKYQFCKLAHIGPKMFDRIMSNTFDFSTSILIKISRVLNVRPQVFMTEDISLEEVLKKF